MVHRSLYLPNGHIWVISTSIEHPQTPVTEKYVRAKLLFAISHFEPLSASSCRVTYSVALNPMGNVPVFVVNLLSTAQPLCIAHVRKFIIDHPESLVIAQQLAAARRSDAAAHVPADLTYPAPGAAVSVAGHAADSKSANGPHNPHSQPTSSSGSGSGSVPAGGGVSAPPSLSSHGRSESAASESSQAGGGIGLAAAAGGGGSGGQQPQDESDDEDNEGEQAQTSHSLREAVQDLASSVPNSSAYLATPKRPGKIQTTSAANGVPAGRSNAAGTNTSAAVRPAGGRLSADLSDYVSADNGSQHSGASDNGSFHIAPHLMSPGRPGWSLS